MPKLRNKLSKAEFSITDAQLKEYEEKDKLKYYDILGAEPKAEIAEQAKSVKPAKKSK